ncbi:MAG: amidohydrolase family protein [candidate division Zixibacteria bacterium]|nr:amidohydrolase family protein [candidate division Zixibacteria bacterium]
MHGVFKFRKIGQAVIGLLCTALLYSVCLGGTTPVLGIRDKTPDARAFINGHMVISPTEQFDNGILIIKDGKVLEIGTGIKIPDGITIIDLAGKSIYPAFIEPFGDYGIIDHRDKKQNKYGKPVYTADRIGGNAWNEAIHAEINWSRFFKPDNETSNELLSQGFAISQSAKQDGIFRGRSCVVLLGDGLPNDLILNSQSAHFISFSKGKSVQDYPSSLMGSIALIRQTLFDIEWYNQAHTAYKYNPAQKMPEFNSAIEALSNISTDRIIIDAGVKSPGLLRAKSLLDEFGLTASVIASGREYCHINDVKEFASKLILPLDFPEMPEINTFADELDVTLAQLRHWESAPSNAMVLEQNDVKFSFTTYRLKKKETFLTNLRKAVKRGLSEETALASLTITPAEICGIGDLAGTLETGKLANFFICDGNIFNEKCEIYSVWTAGKKHELKALPKTLFAGKYELKVGDDKLMLELSGKPSKLTGKVKRDEWSSDLKKFDIDRNKIRFSTPIDSGKNAVTIRFSGRKDKKFITGRCVYANGLEANWQAIRVSELKPDTSVKDARKPEAFFAATTYPNKAFGPQDLPDQKDILIKNATVWTAEQDGILKNTDILIEDGKFVRIGTEIKAPSGIMVIDAGGKHVTPGIIDAHSHLAIAGDVNEGTHAVTPEVRIGDVVNPEQVNIYRQLAGGVTACLSLHGSANPIGGQCQVIKLRWGANAEEMKDKQAAEIIKFALGENVKQSNWGEKYRTRYPQSRLGVEAIMRDVFQAALEYEQDWKKFNALSKKDKKRTIPPHKNIGLDAMVKVLNSDMMVHCHSYMQAEALMLMRLAEEYGFVIDVLIHNLEGYKVADEMVKHGAGTTTFSDWWAYKFEVYDAIPYNASLMAERGVLTTVKSDNIDLARRLNQEAAKVIHYGGISPEEAIKMITINAAIQLGMEKYTGSIAPGKDADFVIWNDYPLSSYAKAEQTWIEGRKYFDIESDKTIRKEIKKERNKLIQKIVEHSAKNGTK